MILGFHLFHTEVKLGIQNYEKSLLPLAITRDNSPLALYTASSGTIHYLFIPKVAI